MKFIFSLGLLLVAMTATAQNVVTLTEDMVLTETMVITEDVTYEGNNFRILCDACNPLIRVENGAQVNFNNISFPRGNGGFISVDINSGAKANWNTRMMTGYIHASPAPDRE